MTVGEDRTCANCGALESAHGTGPCILYGSRFVPEDDDDLLMRLETVVMPSHKPYPTHHLNPDGPEAAARIRLLRAALSQFEITPAMIEAGVSELRDLNLGTPLEAIAREVYLAMETERLSAPPFHRS